jgi:hypothetical protein
MRNGFVESPVLHKQHGVPHPVFRLGETFRFEHEDGRVEGIWRVERTSRSKHPEKSIGVSSVREK